MNKCHSFTEKDGKYNCKFCGIDSKTAELENLRKYDKGIVYAFPKDSMVGGWADRLVSARFCKEWTSNMGDIRQSVYWEFEGQSYYGVYFKSGSDIINYRKIK